MTTALVIAPHPDDEVLGCGGTIARHSAQGDSVHVLVVSRGAPELFPPKEIAVIRAELREAHEMLGINNTLFLDFPAPKLDVVPAHQLADAILGVIKQIRPDVVYLPHRGDIHVDHRAVHMTTLVAARPINDNPVKRLLSYETLSETNWAPPSEGDAFVPTVFVNITDYLELKLKAVACYQSQLKAAPHPRSIETIEALAHLRGHTAGVPAAEAFMLVREII